MPAMLVGETIGEILQATQFAREIASVVSKNTATEDPKTPVSQRSNQKLHPENTELKDRRKKEKQTKLQSIRSESKSPSLQRARSRINFKVSPPKVREFDKENSRYLANRVSPRNRPWARKTVLFPNPLFLSTSSQQPQKFCKTRSPVISRKKETPHKILMTSPPSASKKRETPHKFLIKSPPSASKFQMRIKSPPIVSISSPSRPTSLSKGSPMRVAASKLRRSFSPSRLATRLVSPLKNKRSVQKSDGLVTGLKQRPGSTTVQFPARVLKP